MCNILVFTSLIFAFSSHYSLCSTPTLNRKTDTINVELDNFIENPNFTAFLHSVVSKWVYESPPDIERAKHAKAGWLHIPDMRSHLSTVRTIPEEIIGFVSRSISEPSLSNHTHNKICFS